MAKRNPRRKVQPTTARARASKASPSYREALHSMRTAAQDGIAEAITEAQEDYLSFRALGRSPSHGEEAHALFDGICAAIADSIVWNALPGREDVLARMVGDLVVAKVYALTCQGRA